MKNFQTERIALAAMAVGHCAGLSSRCYVRDRRAFGARCSTNRHPPAPGDARRRRRVPRASISTTAWKVTQGHDVVQDVSCSRRWDRRTGQRGRQACQQFHGGMGYMRGTPIERLWRDARMLAIGGGATEVMLDEAAKRLAWLGWVPLSGCGAAAPWWLTATA